jgi:hypothetical protein
MQLLATNIRGSRACCSRNTSRRFNNVYRGCALYFGPGTPARPCSYSSSWLPCNNLPLKREVTPTLIVARLLAATSVGIENAMRRRAHKFCPYVPTPKNLVLKSGHRVRLE